MLKKLLSARLDQFVSPDVAILLIRITGAALIMTHGFPKFLRILEGDLGFADPIGLGPELSLILVTFAEFVCAIFVLIGFATRLALIPMIFNMLVIVFVAHSGDPFGDKELPLFFMLTYIALFLTGAGAYSLDSKVFGKR